jgi:3-phosphoglycerate kinase
MKNISNFNFKNKKILLRVDLNVPVVDGKVSDLSRIHSIKSTIFKIRENKNKIFLLSHFGRPKGKYNQKYSLEFLCDIIKETLNLNKIFFSPSINEKDLKYIQSQMADGDICLIENIRFCEGEEKNDLDFS